jgi:uncharacterized protein YndB with AHSA1/START domain
MQLMRRPSSAHTRTSFEYSLLIRSTPGRIIAAFFDPRQLTMWWQAARSVTTTKPMGVFAVEWNPTGEIDEVLGRVGGVLHGTVIDYAEGSGFFVADAWWIPPDGAPIGPMALEVSCTIEGPACRLRVRQSGFEDTPRWLSYYNVMSRSWVSSLAALKEIIESRKS